MEEARRLDDQERRREWAWAIGTTALVVAVVMLWTVALVQWMKP
jgi:type IV secretory pathway component VirB8